MNWFIPAFVSSSPDSGGGSATRTGRACARAPRRTTGTARGSGRPSTARSLPAVRPRLAGTRDGSVPGPSRTSVAGAARLPSLHRRLPSATDSETSFERSIRPPRASRAMVAGATSLRLLLRPTRGDDRARRAGPEAERDPEQPAPSLLLPLRPCRRTCSTPLRHPGPERDQLDERARGGLLDEPARSARPGRRSSPVDSSIDVDAVELAVRPLDRVPSPRAAAGRSPRASRRSVIFVLSSTRNVLSRTMHRNRTSRPQNAARTMRATSPAGEREERHIGSLRRGRRRVGRGQRVAYPSGSAHHTEGASRRFRPSRAPTAVVARPRRTARSTGSPENRAGRYSCSTRWPG